MRFVGKPHGKFLKRAPGSYVHNAIYYMPWKHSKFAYWELIDKPPELKVPIALPEESNITKPKPGDLVEMPESIAKELAGGNVMLDMDQESDVVVAPPWVGPVNLDQIFQRMNVNQLKEVLTDNEVKFTSKDKKEALLTKVGKIVGVVYPPETDT